MHNNYMQHITTIRLYADTRKRLQAIGKKAETYDDIIQRLLDAYQLNQYLPRKIIKKFGSMIK